MQPPQIDYAPARPADERRRRMMRRIAFGVGSLIIIAFAAKGAPSAWRHVRMLYWQHQAMNDSAPKDQVVYEDEPAEAPKMLMKPATAAGPNDSVFVVNEPWNRLYELISPPGATPAPILFLHERRNPKGERRLVVVQETTIALLAGADAPGRTADQPFAVTARVFAAGSLFRDPKELSVLTPVLTVPSHLFLQQPTHFRWYAGQPDPRNASHFTIHGTMNGKPITVDGWLRGDDFVEYGVTE